MTKIIKHILHYIFSGVLSSHETEGTLLVKANQKASVYYVGQ